MKKLNLTFTRKRNKSEINQKVSDIIKSNSKYKTELIYLLFNNCSLFEFFDKMCFIGYTDDMYAKYDKQKLNFNMWKELCMLYDWLYLNEELNIECEHKIMKSKDDIMNIIKFVDSILSGLFDIKNININDDCLYDFKSKLARIKNILFHAIDNKNNMDILSTFPEEFYTLNWLIDKNMDFNLNKICSHMKIYMDNYGNMIDVFNIPENDIYEVNEVNKNLFHEFSCNELAIAYYDVMDNKNNL